MPRSWIKQNSVPELPVLASLRFRYRADDLTLADSEDVLGWTDSSGRGNDLTVTGANKPVFRTNQINGHAVVQFANGAIYAADSTGDMSATFGGADTPTTTFLVARFETDSAFQDVVSAYRGANSNPLYVLRNDQTTGYFRVLKRDDAGSLVNDLSTSRVFTNGAWTYVEAIHSGITIDAYQQGTYIPGFGGGLDTGVLTIDRFSIGGRGSTNPVVSGFVAEVIVYTGVLSESDRLLVENYLSRRYFG